MILNPTILERSNGFKETNEKVRDGKALSAATSIQYSLFLNAPEHDTT